MHKNSQSKLPLQAGGNVYLHGARPSSMEPNHLVLADFDPEVRLEQENGHFYLSFRMPPTLGKPGNPPVTTRLLGKARVPELPWENPDGTSLRVNTDYFGKPRNEDDPTPGPFAERGQGEVRLRVW